MGGVSRTFEAIATVPMMICIIAAAALAGWWMLEIVFDWLGTFVW